MAAKRTIRKMEEKVGDLLWPVAEKAQQTFSSVPVPRASPSMLLHPGRLIPSLVWKSVVLPVVTVCGMMTTEQ